jgi:hypothetical protein
MSPRPNVGCDVELPQIVEESWFPVFIITKKLRQGKGKREDGRKVT